MYKLGKIVMYTVEDICETFKVSRETAYSILSLPKAQTVELGRKKLISEDSLFSILNSKFKV